MFPLVLLGNVWSGPIALIFYVIGDSLVQYIQNLHNVRVQCTCTLSFCVSGKTCPIVFKFSVWLGTA